MQLPARTARFQFGTRFVVLHIDDPSALAPHAIGQTIDVGDDLGILMAGVIEQPLLHVDDE